MDRASVVTSIRNPFGLGLKSLQSENMFNRIVLFNGVTRLAALGVLVVLFSHIAMAQDDDTIDAESYEDANKRIVAAFPAAKASYVDLTEKIKMLPDFAAVTDTQASICGKLGAAHTSLLKLEAILKPMTAAYDAGKLKSYPDTVRAVTGVDTSVLYYHAIVFGRGEQFGCGMPKPDKYFSDRIERDARAFQTANKLRYLTLMERRDAAKTLIIAEMTKIQKGSASTPVQPKETTCSQLETALREFRKMQADGYELSKMKILGRFDGESEILKDVDAAAAQDREVDATLAKMKADNACTFR